MYWKYYKMPSFCTFVLCLQNRNTIKHNIANLGLPLKLLCWHSLILLALIFFSESIFILSSAHNWISVFFFSWTESLIQRSKLTESYSCHFTDGSANKEPIVIFFFSENFMGIYGNRYYFFQTPKSLIR